MRTLRESPLVTIDSKHNSAILLVNKIFMKLKKKYAITAVIIAVVIINSLATLRLLFAVVYPERLLKEKVTSYFRENLGKAVKFEDIYIDALGNIIISYFDVSIASDFNDNISLVRSESTRIRLNFASLITATMRIMGVDFYNADITIIKKYGKSYQESLLALIDTEQLIAKIKKSGEALNLSFKGSRLFYRDSLRDGQVLLEMYKIGAELKIDPSVLSYTASGKVKPYKTEIIRSGKFKSTGSIDIRTGDTWEHRLEVENFDLTYLNEYITEYKIAAISLNGGISADMVIGARKGVLSLAGKVELNSLSASSIAKRFELISGENMDIDIDMTADTKARRYTLRRFSLHDGVISLDASGMYVGNEADEALKLKFKTNSIDLSDLSRTLTPIKNIEYAGTLQCDGSMAMDIKKNTVSEMRAGIRLDRFRVVEAERGDAVTLIGETSARVTVTGSSIDLDITAAPLDSDLVIKGRTGITSWAPFRSDTKVTVSSKRMNIENIRLPLFRFMNWAYESAYEDKRGGKEIAPFGKSIFGSFLNNNNVDFISSFDTLFYEKSNGIKNVVLKAGLNGGTGMLREFNATGYDARYALSGQAYFSGDRPYCRLYGTVDNFDLGRFLAESGMSGSLSGLARAELSYEVSFSRVGEILDTARGSLTVVVGRGEMKHTRFQRDLMAFLAKAGHEASPVATVNFEQISLSLSEIGENFWLSNTGIRGDSLLFNITGDYLYEGGINTGFRLVFKKDDGMANIPIDLKGPILAPCVKVSYRKDSPRLCF